MTERQAAVFFEVHRDLPREGPGSVQSTRKAFSCITDLPQAPKVLDIGCGPGAQTICLAELCRGTIFAVDNHPPFIEQLTRNVQNSELGERIFPTLADMRALPFEKESFDLIWAEGSIYIVGLEAGLIQWRPLLRKQGAIAFTEVSWLKQEIPEELNRFWMDAYPAIASIVRTIERIECAGYRLRDHFILPESDWWNDYYTPIEEKLPGLRDKYKDDAEALQVLSIEEDEMNLFRRYSSYYGYVFYIATKADE